jgi:hypothetical protein
MFIFGPSTLNKPDGIGSKLDLDVWIDKPFETLHSEQMRYRSLKICKDSFIEKLQCSDSYRSLRYIASMLHDTISTLGDTERRIEDVLRMCD